VSSLDINAGNPNGMASFSQVAVLSYLGKQSRCEANLKEVVVISVPRAVASVWLADRQIDVLALATARGTEIRSSKRLLVISGRKRDLPLRSGERTARRGRGASMREFRFQPSSVKSQT